MESDSDPNALIRIGMATGAAALLAAAAALATEDGLWHFLAVAGMYVFGVNSILLLGYELQERATDLLRRT